MLKPVILVHIRSGGDNQADLPGYCREHVSDGGRVNSLSTWLLFFWADYLLARLDRSNDKKVIPTPQVSILRIVWFIRGLLSIYTILCTLLSQQR